MELVCLIVDHAARRPLNVVNLPRLERFHLSPSNDAVLALLGDMPSLVHVSSYKHQMMNSCMSCNAPRPGKKCARCRFCFVCESDCQKRDWLSGESGHKLVCREQDGDASLSRLLLQVVGAASTATETELDLAHYWSTNALFGGSDDGSVFFTPSNPDRFHSLSSLRLLRCGVRDEDVAMLGQCCRNLQRLDLSSNKLLSDTALRHIAQYWGGSRGLRNLVLQQVPHLTDEGVRALLIPALAPRILFLDLRYGVKLRGMSGQALRAKLVSFSSQQTIHMIEQECIALQECHLYVKQDACYPTTNSAIQLHGEV